MSAWKSNSADVSGKIEKLKREYDRQRIRRHLVITKAMANPSILWQYTPNPRPVWEVRDAKSREVLASKIWPCCSPAVIGCWSWRYKKQISVLIQTVALTLKPPGYDFFWRTVEDQGIQRIGEADKRANTRWSWSVAIRCGFNRIDKCIRKDYVTVQPSKAGIDFAQHKEIARFIVPSDRAGVTITRTGS